MYFSPSGGIQAEDAVQVVGDQAQAGHVQVVLLEGIPGQRSQAARLAAFGEGAIGSHTKCFTLILLE